MIFLDQIKKIAKLLNLIIMKKAKNKLDTFKTK